MLRDCKSTATCFTCNGKHHTLIHAPFKKDGAQNSSGKKKVSSQEKLEYSEETVSPQSVLATTSYNTQEISGEALLATASIRASSSDGQCTIVRALVDQCAQSSFVTEALCQRLCLKKRRVNVPVSGIGQGLTNSRSEVELAIRPHFPSKFKLMLKAYVLPTITSYQPSCRDPKIWSHIQGLQLADPNFERPGRIDVLLSTQIHARIVQEGLKTGGENAPITTKSRLGWILSGSVDEPRQGGTIVCLQTDGQLDDLLKSFWEIEEPPHALPWSAEDKLCEAHYQKNTILLADGRYQVQLPAKPEMPLDWDNSRQIARSCLLSLERKFNRNPSLRVEYSSAITQMIESNQMRKVDIPPENYGMHYFLPHHAVVKESSTTTRVRPVFNASARNASGQLLNEHLMTGPNLLPQLVLVLAHWRCYPIAFVADVSKMYLQVRLHPEDWKLQSILWREDPRKDIENYVLNTVTFGCGPSAFLASRTLRKLAEDDGAKFPLATSVIHNEMYMDDVLSGAFDVGTAVQKRNQLNLLLLSGGFSLAKWMTNDSNLLSSFESSDLAKEATLKVSLGFSVLGLVWEPRTDVFRFNVTLEPLSAPITKRKVLSSIAGMFDPSGWISPVLITLKIFMQSLWLLTKEWDTPLPDAEIEKWRAFEVDLQELPSVTIPRWNGYMPGTHIELHGFADASKFAYAAVLYLRLICQGQARVTLLASKTKVAPLKTLSIPRLELCAAHLLAKLAASFVATSDFAQAKLHLWSDSKTTLHWIHGLPARWPVFVANRCTDIITHVPQAIWHYVNTKHNPADLATRGCTVSVLRSERLWWHGPEILSATTRHWTSDEVTYASESVASEAPAEQAVLAQSTCTLQDCDLFDRFSSYMRLKKVMVHCLRFVTRLAGRCNLTLKLQFEAADDTEVTVQELDQSARHLCRMTQVALLPEEMQRITDKAQLDKQHPLAKLCPILVNGLIRVGGRLRHAALSEERKHPIILPAKSRLVQLLVDYMHEKMFHGGTHLIATHLRQQYWIPRLKNVISARLRRCVGVSTIRSRDGVPAHG
ncbi:unnamed protein product [Trichogramma brassicae]|uniref:Uncharacterized protein n=1 Tax=Trichogramma brassicae TaxID=86971 RepID=A0A6H5I447_9HYME|nr:unnamed protein product [Trichogramma brassicae]